VLRLSYYKFAAQVDLFIVQPAQQNELMNESIPNFFTDGSRLMVQRFSIVHPSIEQFSPCA